MPYIQTRELPSAENYVRGVWEHHRARGYWQTLSRGESYKTGGHWYRMRHVLDFRYGDPEDLLSMELCIIDLIDRLTQACRHGYVSVVDEPVLMQDDFGELLRSGVSGMYLVINLWCREGIEWETAPEWGVAP